MLKDTIINRYCTLRVKLVPRMYHVHIRYYFVYIPHYNSITCVTNLVHVIYTSAENMLYDIFERPQRPKILSNCQIYPSRPATVAA